MSKKFSNNTTLYIFLIAGAITLAGILYIYNVASIKNYSYFLPKLKGYNVLGIDVSRYQDNIDWEMVAEQDISFAFIKATEGNYKIDPFYKKNWRNIKKTSILRGAYHFYRPEMDWKTQYKLFVNTVTLERGDLPPVLDIEHIRKDKDRELLIKNIKKWLEAVEKYYGVKPIVYSYQSYYNDHLLDEFRGYNLWIASYRLTAPTLDDEGHWEFWQYTDKAHLEGIEHKVDLNCFFGNKEQLKKLVKK
jgi:lysozyme